MPALAKTLSPRDLERIRKPGRHAGAGVPGLVLIVHPSGQRSWALRARVDGRSTDVTLGVAFGEGLSVAEAREAARTMRDRIKMGRDPVAERRAKRRADSAPSPTVWTFERAAREVWETLSPGWRNPKHAAQFISTLERYAFPVMGEKLVGEVAVADVVQVLKPIWTKRVETARRVLQRMGTVLNWAVAHGHSAGNPAAVVAKASSTLLPKQKREVEHHAALPHQDLPALMKRLEGVEGNGALALRFALFTAARSGEVRHATWSEIDTESATWTIPAERMKASRAHRVPLSKEALALLKAVPRVDDEELIFVGTKAHRPMSDMTMAAVLKRLGIDATVHGSVRSGFRDWCAETGVSRELAERALAHVVESKTEAAYYRSDQLEQRRPVMQAWAKHLTSAR